jgi:glycosyltransferase involved in cell wall biosynthesis
MLLAAIQSFNRVDLLSRALPSLHAALGRSCLRSQIVIFDAGSTDGSIDWLQNFRKNTAGGPPPPPDRPPSCQSNSVFQCRYESCCRCRFAQFPGRAFHIAFRIGQPNRRRMANRERDRYARTQLRFWRARFHRAHRRPATGGQRRAFSDRARVRLRSASYWYSSTAAHGADLSSSHWRARSS